MYRGPFSTVYDTVIFGGGMCGIGTALTLAGKGKDILVVERRTQLGWEITSAFNCDFGESTSDAAKKIKGQLKSAGGFKDGLVSPPITEIYLSELMKKANLDVLLYSYPLQLLTEKGLVCGVVTGSKNGEQVEDAVLWQQTGLSFKSVKDRVWRYTIVFNGVDKGIKRISIQGDKNRPAIEIKPSVWTQECCVEFVSESDSISSARLKVPDVITFVRENIPQLKGAIVTHTGFELFPLDVKQHLAVKYLRHPDVGNLFSSGIWAIPDDREREKRNTVTGRLETGEEAGLELKKHFSGYHRYIPKVPEFKGVPVKKVYRSEVVIAGGGTAGALAAIASARNKAKTILIEASTMLGGMGTGGGIHIYYYGVPGGLQDEVDKRVKHIASLFCGSYTANGFHPEAKKLVLEQMCAEEGVKVLYGMTTVGVEMAGKKVKSILTVSENVKVRCSGKVFVDSTGDGDVAVAAGVPYKIGRESDELPHAYSQSGGWLDTEKKTMRVINFDAGYVDPFDTVDITRGRRLGLYHFKRDRYTDETRPTYIAPLLGLRQSRQIMGDYLLTLPDEIYARRFRDCIGFGRANYDNHFVHCFDVANQSDAAVLWTWILGYWTRIIGCEIPYRSLLPANVEGLLVSCRALSLDVDAHYEFRMQNDMQRIGEAAGIAAALSVRHKTTPRKLDVKVLQKKLRKTGALDKKMRPVPAIPRYSLKKLKEIFLSEKPGDAVWEFSFRKEAIPFLKNVLKAGNKDSRFWASVALAMHKEKDAVPELARCVSGRMQETPEGRGTVPLWKSSVVLLGRVGDERATEVLSEILSDSTADIDTLIAVVRALGRLGDKRAVPALLKFLSRRDIPYVRKMAVSSGPVSKPIEEDSAAESLKRLGSPRESITKKYLNDTRSYVRRYAKRILTG